MQNFDINVDEQTEGRTDEDDRKLYTLDKHVLRSYDKLCQQKYKH